MGSYISDGYTRTGYIAAAVPEESGERLYDDLEFTYRPATRMDVTRLDAEIVVAVRNKEFDPKCAERAEQIACKFVASRIDSWTLKDVGIHDVPVTAAACERIHPYLFTRLYGSLRGTLASDVKPNEEARPTDAEQVKN